MMTRTDLDVLRRLIARCQEIDQANAEDGDIAAGQLLTREFSDLVETAFRVVLRERNTLPPSPEPYPVPPQDRASARILELERLMTIVRGEMRVVKDWMVHAQAKVLQTKCLEVFLTPRSRSTKTRPKTRPKTR